MDTVEIFTISDLGNIVSVLIIGANGFQWICVWGFFFGNASGTKEGIRALGVSGASKSEGARLLRAPETSHCLGGHDGAARLRGARMPAASGHMVRCSLGSLEGPPPLSRSIRLVFLASS